MGSGHGKGIVGRLGGTLKSKADSKVGQGSDITSAKRFINAVQEVKIDLQEIKLSVIDSVQKIIPKDLNAAQGTILIHQIIWNYDDSDNLYLRKRSCMHNESFSPCNLCDLKIPNYCPTNTLQKKLIIERKMLQ